MINYKTRKGLITIIGFVIVLYLVVFGVFLKNYAQNLDDSARLKIYLENLMPWLTARSKKRKEQANNDQKLHSMWLDKLKRTSTNLTKDFSKKNLINKLNSFFNTNKNNLLINSENNSAISSMLNSKALEKINDMKLKDTSDIIFGEVLRKATNKKNKSLADDGSQSCQMKYKEFALR